MPSLSRGNNEPSSLYVGSDAVQKIYQGNLQVWPVSTPPTGDINFGALTPAGAGGAPIAGSDITDGDPSGHWEIVGGMLVPSVVGEGVIAGTYTLTIDGSDTVTVAVEANKATARADEIVAVFTGLPTSARGLEVRDGDQSGTGRIRLPAKVFTNEMVLAPENYVENADQRLSTRPVRLDALTIGGDSSNTATLRMENLTVQGFVFQSEQGLGETEFSNGIVLVERPSRHVTIRQNEIWSRTTEDILAADDYRNNLSTSRQLRGLATGKYSGANEHIRIEYNYIHDVSRGAGLVGNRDYQGVRSRFCNNIIEHCYTNFFTCGWSNGFDIFDNYCMGVYAADETTDGYVGSSGDGPHSAAGGSFDAGGSKSTQNISLIGNFFHIGWKRTKLHADNGLPTPVLGATGIKFNDPKAADSYWNIIVAFNTVVSHGLCMELSGAGADTFIDVFNNTLAHETYNTAGSLPVFYFTGAENVRLFNNIGCNYTIGSSDNSGFYVRTLSTLQGYGNVKINGGGNLSQSEYFVGDPVKGLDLLTLDEALAAYVPKPTTRAMTAAQKKGALGTGLYSGNGVHSVTYNKPVANTGTSHSYPLTTWSGNYLQRSSALENTATTNGFTFAFQGQTDALTSGQKILYSQAGQRVYLAISSNRTLTVKFEWGSTTFVDAYAAGVKVPDDAVSNIVCSCNFADGTVLFAQDGELTNWTVWRTVDVRSLSWNHNARIFANELTAAGNRWEGDAGVFYLTDEFVDLETEAGLNSFYAADGGFVDFGPDGSVPTGNQPLIYIAGTPPATNNLGDGGTFSLR